MCGVEACASVWGHDVCEGCVVCEYPVCVWTGAGGEGMCVGLYIVCTFVCVLGV